jgi:hypothetical protein
VGAAVNRDARLQSILMMLLLKRSRDPWPERSPATFSLSLNRDVKQRSPSTKECVATSGFS